MHAFVLVSSRSLCGLLACPLCTGPWPCGCPVQVLLATESLTLVDGNVATEFIAGVGHEIVQFEPSGVELVGRVEEYLTKVLHGIMLTLQVQHAHWGREVGGVAGWGQGVASRPFRFCATPVL